MPAARAVAAPTARGAAPGSAARPGAKPAPGSAFSEATGGGRRSPAQAGVPLPHRPRAPWSDPRRARPALAAEPSRPPREFPREEIPPPPRPGGAERNTESAQPGPPRAGLVRAGHAGGRRAARGTAVPRHTAAPGTATRRAGPPEAGSSPHRPPALPWSLGGSMAAPAPLPALLAPARQPPPPPAGCWLAAEAPPAPVGARPPHVSQRTPRPAQVRTGERGQGGSAAGESSSTGPRAPCPAATPAGAWTSRNRPK